MASGGDKSFLPLEIIINILKRLPVKSIVRFGCVCKEWKKLFKTPTFIAEHFHHPVCKTPLLLLHEYNFEHNRSFLRLLNCRMETVEVMSFPSIDDYICRWRIIGSCNGLLCVQVDHHQYSFANPLWLWNPLTREVREVPNTLNEYQRVGSVGFGFSSVVNDYKIVRFDDRGLCINSEDPLDYYTKPYRVEVYSLSTGSWKELEFGDIRCSQALSRAVNVDGNIFWLVSKGLVSFDIATEAFTLTQIPTLYGIYPLELAVHENKLVGYHGVTEDSGSRFIYMWVMEEVASESGKSFRCAQKYRIEQVTDALYILCVWRNEVVYLDKKCLFSVEGKLKCILYLLNLITNEKREFNASTVCHWCDAFNYEESLVSVWNNQVE